MSENYEIRNLSNQKVALQTLRDEPNTHINAARVSVKKCSIVYIGDPAAAALFITTLPFQNLTEDYELLFSPESFESINRPLRELIKPKSGILDLSPSLNFEQRAIETAKKSACEILVFVNRPAGLDEICQAVRAVDNSTCNIVSMPEKTAIVVSVSALLSAGGLKEMVRQQPCGDAGNNSAGDTGRMKFWDTLETFNAGLGHVLQIPDRTEMLRLMPQNCIVAEIGVFKGDFSAQIIGISKPAELHLVDFWPEAIIQSGGESISGLDACKFVRERFSAETALKKVFLHRGLSWQVSQTFPDEYFDWIYIDAGHHYKAVKSDLQCWYPKVKTGGFITGHDYIEKAMYGVVSAVNEFIRQNRLAFIALTAEAHGSRSWILKKLP